jgi:putative methyltransferase
VVQLTPVLALLLVHDHLLSKGGIALPQSHGLRASIERHKARLTSELTRARLRRKIGSLDDLRAQVEAESKTGPIHPRWIRINTLRSSVTDQLQTTFTGLEAVSSVQEIIDGATKAICFDVNIPNLVAVSPGSIDFTKTEAYKSGAIILQDKASCFPAYLLDPGPADGHVIDSCAAPGNKTTQLGAILHSRSANPCTIFAFEKDKNRAKTLERMVKLAGSESFTQVNQGQDFLKVNPLDDAYKDVGALLLDPSCSGSGIVGRDDMPDLHLPEIAAQGGTGKAASTAARKRKRSSSPSASTARSSGPGSGPVFVVDDDGKTTAISSAEDLRARIEALATFQLTLLLHAFRFPAARKITYSTCSIYAGENEHVVMKALQSDIARERGWRILKRESQVPGLKKWPVRGAVEACDGDQEVADACIRTYRDDGRGVMGFFVAGFVREAPSHDDDGPYVRDDLGMIVRDEMGIPILKATGKKAVDRDQMDSATEVVPETSQDDGPYVRDEQGRIVRDANGLPTLKPSNDTQPRTMTDTRSESENEDEDDHDSEWGGFDD